MVKLGIGLSLTKRAARTMHFKQVSNYQVQLFFKKSFTEFQTIAKFEYDLEFGIIGL